MLKAMGLVTIPLVRRLRVLAVAMLVAVSAVTLASQPRIGSGAVLLRRRAAGHRRRHGADRERRAARRERTVHGGWSARVSRRASRRPPCRSDRQDGHAGDGQRPRAHRLRGLHQLGRREPHAAERRGPLAARSVLRRRRHDVSRDESSRAGPADSTRSASREVSSGGAIPVHARLCAARRRSGCGADCRDQHARRDQRSVDPEEARARVRRMAEQKIGHVKMWVDDRGGTYPKLQPDTYLAIIDEAHKHRMVVHAHAIQLADQKAVVRAGADVLVHMVQRQQLDDEYLALLREKKPYWATVIGLGDPTEVCKADPFFEQALPPQVIARIRATTERRGLAPSCGPPSPTAGEREEQMARNFPQYIAAGVRIVLGTDTGIHPGHTFGSGEHVELARWVQLGLPPAEAIVAATSRPAQLMGLTDLGSLAVGKRASFIVLDGNPLENIRNTRRIADVYIDGARFDREGLLTGVAEIVGGAIVPGGDGVRDARVSTPSPAR